MDTLIQGLSLEKREWLVHFIQRNKELPKDEQVKRADIPDRLNEQFPGTKFTLAKLSHLYTHFNGQGAFIADTLEKVRKAKASEASKAKAPVEKNAGPTRPALLPSIERPPEVVAPVPQKPAAADSMLSTKRTLRLPDTS